VQPRLLAFALAALVAACSEASPSPSSAKAPPPPVPVAIAACKAGMMPTTAPDTCAPVGPTAVPEGFLASTPDWGFHAIVPTAVCGDATRAVIGQATCQPIDDCNAPFPPSNAKVVVRSGATPGPGVASDIAGALAQVSPGDTIAIDEGTYAGVTVDRDVNFVGRCASMVIVATQTAGDTGLGADGPYKVTARSINFQGFDFALWVGGGASMTVTSSIFSLGEVAAWVTTDGTLTFQNNLVDSTPDILVDGVIIANGGHATVTDSEFRDIHIAVDAYGTGALGTASRIVASERSNELSGLVIAADGGEVDLDHSQLVAVEQFIGGAQNTDVRNPGSIEPGTLRISTSELLHTEPTDPSGFDVDGRSTFELTQSTLGYRARIAVSAEDGANVTIAQSVIRPVLPSDVATLDVGAGLVINSGARLSIDGSAIVSPGQTAILASNECQIALTSSLIEGTWEFARTDLTTRLGIGQAISLSGNASLVMTDSTLENNAGISIWMSNETATVEVLRSAILGTQDPATATSTAGLLAWGGTIDVQDSLIQGIPDTAIAVGQAMGTVSQTVLSKNAVGFRMMGTSTLDQVTTTVRPTAGRVVSQDNVLVDTPSAESNATLPLGDCHCVNTDISGILADSGSP
jgi:hypothetical protein